LIQIETQAPTPTEIASPISTSRKLLKIPDLETVSPTLPESPQKRAFRTRIVSESQMGNVNEAAVETLITDRFQTIFSEGKTLQVKENSPVKENYSRMQSANIASTKLSSRNLNGLTINCESPLRNRTSIVLSPSDISPELAVEIGPQDSLFSPNETDTSSIPKLLKLLSSPEKVQNEDPFGSSLFSTLEKVERLKDENHIRRGVSTDENMHRPPPCG